VNHLEELVEFITEVLGSHTQQMGEMEAKIVELTNRIKELEKRK
jgi:hypothetical protein